MPANPLTDPNWATETTDLIVTTAGGWDGQSAGIERVDTPTRTTELMLSAAELGGIVAAYDLDAEGNPLLEFSAHLFEHVDGPVQNRGNI